MFRRTVSICLVLLMMGSARATDFTIKLNTPQPNAPYRSSGPDDSNFDSTQQESWGTTAHDAGNFSNLSSSDIRGMYFKCLNPMTHRFSTNCDGQGLFSEVWMNSDQTEVIFRGGVVLQPTDQTQTYFWMQVQPSTQGDPDGYDEFSALMYSTEPAIPSQGGWRQIRGATSAGASPCPSCPAVPIAAAGGQGGSVCIYCGGSDDPGPILCVRGGDGPNPFVIVIAPGTVQPPPAAAPARPVATRTSRTYGPRATQVQTVVEGALNDLKFENFGTPKPGAPIRFKVTAETLKFLHKVEGANQTIEVDYKGHITIK